MRAAESGLHAEEAHVLNKVASVLTRETLSKSVYAYKDLFDPKALMDNADTREFMLLPGLGYCKFLLVSLLGLCLICGEKIVERK